ncbi:MAG: hypothetical protein COT26_01030 [Candidatus Kerfeldbacteria bacterium CG08_land_8_20_14_0_20_43_14]|uniref:Magnesium transporter CorA n=1 Tax=Candidatus Kerfeldbacteria bacterium CG08_land_8_20_14_0_20_43_14 TaxID=2014246 RepID=A0A2H0YRG4_9BACT|nr:MAG: hypothetical protein COT26_01030 [Candidatus Kerfeldbacteria bacterium CG08_land_8_20_14_0_20_43_14]
MPISEAKVPSCRWINITGATAEDTQEIKFLRENFPYFHALDIKECINTGQRPKLEIYDRYAFLVLLFPIYNRKTKEIESSEIDFFISSDYLITIHDNRLPIIDKIFNEFKAHNHLGSNGKCNILAMLTEVITQQLNACMPMLDHISMDLHSIEKLIFRGREKEMVQEILITRRNIVDFRKTMQAHKNSIKKLAVANRLLKISQEPQSEEIINNAVEKSKEIWDNLEAFREAIEALQATNESLISFRLNDIMKTYTTISVIIFTLTLTVAIFTARLSHTPLVGTPFDFYILLGLLALIGAGAVAIFKKMRWI